MQYRINPRYTSECGGRDNTADLQSKLSRPSLTSRNLLATLKLEIRGKARMPTKRYPSVLAALFVLLSFLDLIFTLRLGIFCEANPLAVIIWQRFGAYGLYLAKGLAVGSILGCCELVSSEYAGRLLAFGIGAETVALLSLFYFWLHMPRMAL